MTKQKKIRLPKFAILKRDDLSKPKMILIRIISFVVTLLFAIFICFLIIKENYFEIIGTFFQGVLGVKKIWKLILDACLLLAFGIAIVPAFKMKYWNMGANGQVLIGALVAIVLMFYMEDFASKSSLNNILLIILMFVCSIIASVIWAVIPAIFKVLFKTNETLFTLMMNYIAAGLVAFINYIMTQGNQETPGIVNLDSGRGWLPEVLDKYFLPVLIILIMTTIISIYMSKTKHGYEISVVGDSINTAKYVGMKTKKIIIRTLILSGIITGVIGFLYTSGINRSLNSQTCGSLGFTAILIAWLSNFNPFIMGIISFLLAFITIGTQKISSIYHLGSNDLSSVIIGLLFFSILISEFFIKFKIINTNNIRKDEETC